ncbi:MAG: ATP-binding protein [Cyclobacteriaceae bacterium]
MKFNARTKVIIGFFLAICLIVGVVAVTYISVKKLLVSVESLSEPNEKLRNLNHLLAEIYQLDKSRSVFIESDTSGKIDYFDQIQARIKKVQSLSTDTSEIRQIKKIGHNVNELLVVYKGLEDVKKNLFDRNFSKEALTNIERKIRRKEELSRLQSLGKIRIGISNGVTTDTTSSPKTDSVERENGSKSISVVDKVEMEKLMAMLRTNLNRMEPNAPQVLSSSDSVLYAVRQIVSDITNEEQYLRSRLSMLEQELNNKNKELIINIQDIVTSLQNEALLVSKAENDSAYELTYHLSLLLGVLIIVGVIGSTGFIFSIVREIKKSETYQEKLSEAKMRSDNLAKTKQDFLASMSHEIRNPLHVIQGYNEALAKTSLKEEQNDYVRMIGFASGTLLGIVNDILDFSKLEAGKIEIERTSFNPNILLSNMQDFFEHKTAEKGLSLEFSLSIPEGKWMKGDQLRINQILNNLISNAIKFTEKGKITVSFQYFDVGKIALQVEDTGMGITPELQKNLFKEFNQGDSSISRKFGGTGLGLAIVKKLVDLQKGSISAESRDGGGTIIKVILPTELVEPLEKSHVDLEVDFKHPSLVGLKVLLVDDDEIGLKFSSIMMKALGAQVTTYEGGLDFKENFHEQDFDLAILDIQMPEIDGYQVLKMLRTYPRYRNLPIIAITANVFAEEKQKLDDEGFNCLILKPFNEQKLISTIDKILSGHLSGHHEPRPSEKERNIKQMAAYDLSEIKKFCMGDEELFKEIMEGFYTQTGLDLIQINKALDDGNYGKIQFIAHQLSSRLGQLKIADERKMAKNIEISLKEGIHRDIDQKVWALTEGLNHLLEDIAQKHGYSLVS